MKQKLETPLDFVYLKINLPALPYSPTLSGYIDGSDGKD